MPVRNLPETKPPAPGAGLYGWKQGNDFPEAISGGRRPSNSIWPSKHEICNTHRIKCLKLTDLKVKSGQHDSRKNVSETELKSKISLLFPASLQICLPVDWSVCGQAFTCLSWGEGYVLMWVCLTCMVFTVDPLAPDWTISWRLLSGKDVWSPPGMHTYEEKHHMVINLKKCEESVQWVDVLMEKVGNNGKHHHYWTSQVQMCFHVTVLST